MGYRMSIIVGLIACFLLSSSPPISRVQAATSADKGLPKEMVEKQTTLLGILRSINLIERERQAKQTELQSPAGEGRKEDLKQEIQRLNVKLANLRQNLTELASGVDLDVFSDVKPSQIDLREQLFDLLRPVLSELSRLSAGPREIEDLRMRIVLYNEQRRALNRGLTNLAQLESATEDEELSAHLKQLHQQWQDWYQEIETQARIADQQLQQKLQEEPTLTESARNLLQLFFRSRGRNFVLACLAFALFWLICHRTYGWMQRTSAFRQRRRSFSIRLFDVIYNLVTITGAVFCFLLVLYVFKDWVLLTLALLFLLGIAWTSKQTLPRFVREVTLLLNLGAVREGERLIYNGVPWLVRSLNFYTQLVNPELEGGSIRLPLRDFHDLRSRPFEPGEPWFPTRLNDWVLLDSECLGKIVLQTPEIVRLVLLGGSRKTFGTLDFLAQYPQVLSTGFRIDVTFGLDYQHQADITRDIPAAIAAALHESLDRQGLSRHLVNLVVEFAEAGASSLDLQVLADFAGAAAPNYFILRRALQRICVDACNDHGWVIPFAQVTLHMAASDRQSLPSDLDNRLHDGNHR